MFAVIYRWRLVPGSEEQFRTAWAEMTESIRTAYGTCGSRLHRNADGEHVAYAVWPDRAAWSHAGTQPSANPAALAAMKACISESFPAMPLDVVEDSLALMWPDIERLFPVRTPSSSLGLDGPIRLDNEDVILPVVMATYETDGSIRDYKGQELRILARHRGDRAIALVEVATRRFVKLPSEMLEMLMPQDLFAFELLDADLEPAAFERVLDDRRARHILEHRSDDAALFATLDPAVRRPPPMLANAELEARLLVDPDDRALAAVYGDWLSERGDRRGELVAIQLALENTPDDDALHAREQQLLDDLAYEWLDNFAWLSTDRVACTWRRGFLHAIALGGDRYLNWWTEHAGDIRTLARLPNTAFLRSVSLLPKPDWSDSAFVAIGEVGLPASVESLAITIEEDVGELEPAYPGLARLRSLRLEVHAADLGSLELPELRSFEFVTRGLTCQNVLSLERRTWPHLERLVLWLGTVGEHECDVELDDVHWILRGENLPRLTTLGLCGRDAEDLLVRLVDAPLLGRLHELDLAGGFAGADTAATLRRYADRFAHLRTLRIPRALYREHDDSIRSLTDLGPHVVIDERFIPVYE